MASGLDALTAMPRSAPGALAEGSRRRDRNEDLAVEVRPAHERAALLLEDADHLEFGAADLELLVQRIDAAEQAVLDVATDHAHAPLGEHVELEEESPELRLCGRHLELLLGAGSVTPSVVPDQGLTSAFVPRGVDKRAAPQARLDARPVRSSMRGRLR
jgi:hypothetical protein